MTDRSNPDNRAAKRRVYAVVAAVALLAAGTTIGVTLLQTRNEGSSATNGTLRKGSPPLELDFGLQSGKEVEALEQATVLYRGGHRREAALIFKRYDTPAAVIGAAFAQWPDHALSALKQLAARHPRNAMVLLHLGLAFYWNGEASQAVREFDAAEAANPDTPYALTAESLLHPSMPPLPLPQFIPAQPTPHYLRRLNGSQQLAVLRKRARQGDPTAMLFLGIQFQELGRAVSAEREFAEASKLDRSDAEIQAAAAVGLFTKDAPARALHKMAFLAKRFPGSASVLFHLGYLDVWVRRYEAATAALHAAIEAGPHSIYVGPARLLLKSIAGKR